MVKLLPSWYQRNAFTKSPHAFTSVTNLSVATGINVDVNGHNFLATLSVGLRTPSSKVCSVVFPRIRHACGLKQSINVCYNVTLSNNITRGSWANCVISCQECYRMYSFLHYPRDWHKYCSVDYAYHSLSSVIDKSMYDVCLWVILQISFQWNFINDRAGNKLSLKSPNFLSLFSLSEASGT